MAEKSTLPLAGVRVIEFTHMVMGPAAGLMLADLGADVIKIEPVDGDSTRHLLGSGAGYFPMYNRNKRSLCVDLKSPAGRVQHRRRVIALRARGLEQQWNLALWVAAPIALLGVFAFVSLFLDA